jgi:hypothetical protein
MKNNKLTAEKVNADFIRSIRSGRYFNWGIKPRMPSYKLPTPTQLTTLAATLTRTSQENHEKLCSSALNLWFTSIEAIHLQKQCNEDYQLLDAEMKAENKKLPQPKESELPMTLDNFLKRLWPKKDTGERAEIFKEWLSSVLLVERYIKARDAGQELSSSNKPTKEEVIKKYAEARQEPIDKQRFYHWRDTILPWYARYRVEQTSKVRRAVRLKAVDKKKAEATAKKATEESATKKVEKKL